ncbi:MAG: YkvA family protein [Cyanobacteria bacterium P01_A01_bin.45]
MNFSIQSVYSWYRNLIRNPKYRWWVILGTIVYFVSPFDISPDVIPIVGQLDDVFLVTLLVTELSSMAIDKVKARKGGVEETRSDSQDVNSSETDSIDVDAVRVK